MAGCAYAASEGIGLLFAHMATPKTGRNDKCHCGSGKKFKQCCGTKAPGSALSWQLLLVGVAGVMVAVIFFAISAARHDNSSTPAAGRVWSTEHGHYH